jgi:dimethylglycine dehydrogenase
MAMASGRRAATGRADHPPLPRHQHHPGLPTGEWKVSTEQGDIVCEHVVNAGGTYARQMGEWSGLQLPMTSMTHHYFVTDTVPEFRDLERNCRSSATTSWCPAISGWSRSPA